MYNYKTKTNLNLKQLEPIWQEFSQKQNADIFLDWAWVKTWVTNIADKEKLFLEQAFYNGVLVGLILHTVKQNKFLVFNKNTSYVMKSGNESADEIWIEYNNFLVEDSHKEKLLPDFLSYVFEQHKLNSMLIGTTKLDYNEILSPLFLTRNTWLQPSYEINLNEFHEQIEKNKNYSKNFKNQLKRSIKKATLDTELEIVSASDIEEKLSFFNELAHYHKQKWKNKEKGFYNPLFTNFHLNLIRHYPEKVRVLKVFKGSDVLGYLYFLCHNNTAYFYMAGLNFIEFENYKPGIICHYLACSYFKQKGFQKYDFMAGEARYKKSFSDIESDMTIYRLSRNSLINQLIEGLIKIKRKLNTRF